MVSTDKLLYIVPGAAIPAINGPELLANAVAVA